MTNKKKLVNNKKDVEKEMLEAVRDVYPGLFVDRDLRIVMINRERKYRVGIVSGGGSGHEPFPTGFVGEGMFTAAIAGKVFTSPPIGNIVATIQNVAQLNKGGVLLLIMNYTGDVLNFSSAMEQARAKGCYVESIVVSDDVSLYGKDVKSLTGGRGMAGMVLIAKILGGLSTEGKSLTDLVTIGRCINCRLGTIGVGFQACTLPDNEEPMFDIDEDTIEFGLGIHGEAGSSTIAVSSVKEIVMQMLTQILSCLDIEEKANVVTVINNLGSLSQMEMLIISREVRSQLVALKITVERIYVGSLVTSIDMRGFQISILNITGNLNWIRYLDEETEAYAWPGRRISHVIEKFPPRIKKIEIESTVVVMDGMMLNKKYSEVFRNCLHEVARVLINECDTLNALDTVVGDGDCGTTLRYFSEGIIRELHKLPISNVASTLAMLSKLAEVLMGGTSGGIFSLMLMGAAKDCKNWETCWFAGIEMIQKYSSAKLGDRTLLDALIPACKAFTMHLKDNGDHSWPIALKIALERAEQGCEATKDMVARAGRATYVNPSKVTEIDPGAFAMVLVLRTLVGCLVPCEEEVYCPV